MLGLSLLACMAPICSALTSEKIRLMLSNGTSFLAIDELVNLAATEDHDLRLINPERASNLKISTIKTFNEFSTVSYPNESLVDTVSFRMGKVAQRAYQLVITHDYLYLYELVSVDGSLTMAEQKRWNVNKTVNNQSKYYFRANSTTSAIGLTSNRLHFVLLTVQNGTVNEMINVLQINCSLADQGSFSCDLSLVTQSRVLPMYFVNMNNESMVIRCEPTLRALMGDFSPVQPVNDGIEFEYYFARYCKLSQLEYAVQRYFENHIQIMGVSTSNTIELITTIHSISMLTESWPLQLVELVEFKNSLIYFDLNRTYTATISNTTKINRASQWFDNSLNLQTGFVECQQNSYSVLSCFMDLYVKPITCHPRTFKSKILAESTTSRLHDDSAIHSTSTFTEFISLQSRIFKVPPITLPTIKSNVLISAINLNFIVFRQQLDSSHTNITILQRGTSNDIGEVTLNGTVIGMKALGDNFMIYRESDIGLVVRKLPASQEGFSLTIYSIQLPVFKIETGFTNTSYPCYQYIKDCQLLSFNFSYVDRNRTFKGRGSHVPADKKPQQTPERKWLSVDFYQINNNFTGLLPKTKNSSLELDIQRDKLSMNITNLFYGLPISYKAKSQESKPGAEIGNFNLTVSGDAFVDLKINVSSGKFGSYCDASNTKVSPYVQRNNLGNLFITVKVYCNDPFLTSKVLIFMMADYLDPQQDTEVSIAWNNMQMFDFYTSVSDSALLVNDQVQYGQYYLFYGSTRPERSVEIMQFGVMYGSLMPQSFLINKQEFTPLMNMRTRVLRNVGASLDSCIIAFNESAAHIYEIVFLPPNPDIKRVKFNRLLQINIENDSFEWPVGKPLKMIDIYMADFNALYIHAQVKLDNGTVTEIMQVHQCDFGDAPICFFYTYIDLNYNQTVIVDDATFNFLVMDRTSMQLYFYQMLDFKLDFIHLIKSKMASSRTNNLRGVLGDPGLFLVPGHLNRSINAGYSQVFAIGVMSTLNPRNSGFLVFDFGIQSIIPVRFVPSLDVAAMFFAQMRNPSPYQFPVAFKYDADSVTLNLMILNAANGLSVKTPSYMITESGGETFETEVFQAILTSVSSPEFLQAFKGVTRFNFNLDSVFKVSSNEERKEIAGLTRGFLQNTTISCLEDDDSSYSITRNFTVKLSCPSKSTSYTYLLHPFVTKDYDFFWSDVPTLGSTKNSLHSHMTMLANITSAFRLNSSDEFLFLFHNNITVVRMNGDSKIVMFIDVYEQSNGMDISYEKCISLSENTQIGDALELELLCLEDTTYSIYSFTLNLKDLRRNSNNGPARFHVPATQWTVVNVLIEQFFSKSRKTFYRGKLLYVLDSIVLENYNNKAFLNVYQVTRKSNPNNNADFSLVWSTLSLDQFSLFDIVEFAVSKKVEDCKVYREYDLHILMVKSDTGEVAHMKNQIKINVNTVDNSEKANFTLSDVSYLGKSDLESVQLFTLNSEVFVYGFSKDSIFEWPANYAEGTQPVLMNTYKHLMVCADSTEKDVFKLSSLLLLYCYNATSDGSMGDSVLVYSTSNIKDEGIFPIEQMNIPDVDYPSNLFLAAYETQGVGKFLVSNSRTFMTQYQVSPQASVVWKRSNWKGSIDLQVKLVSSNILSSAAVVIDFKVGLFDIVGQYAENLQESSGLVVVVVLYFLMLSCMLSIKYFREKEMLRKDSHRKTFLQTYQALMQHDKLPRNLKVSRDSNLSNSMRRYS